MTKKELVEYVCKETKFKSNELGGISITFKADGLYLTVYRSGKKAKDVPSSKILNGFSVEDALLICEAVQKQCEYNVINKSKVVSVEDRIKAMNVSKEVNSKDQEEW